MTDGPDPVDGSPAHRATARPLPSVLVVLVVLSLGTLLLGIWGSLRWSLIPVRLDATVTRVSWAEEGPPFRILHTDDGRSWKIDVGLYRRMGRAPAIEGRRIEKSAWSRTVTVGGRPVPLEPSGQFWLTSSAFGLLVGAVLVRYRRRFRASSAADLAEEEPTRLG